MVRQNKVRPQTPSEFFPDAVLLARSSRPARCPAAGPYVINGQVLKIDGKPVYPYEDSPVNTGRIPGTTNLVPINPLPITRAIAGPRPAALPDQLPALPRPGGRRQGHHQQIRHDLAWPISMTSA